jgi:hypothetical protein
MKIGDEVRRSDDASKSWAIINTKSDARSLWIQLDGYHRNIQEDVWHDARYFEVINGSK